MRRAIIPLMMSLLVTACIPSGYKQATDVSDSPAIYPDYSELTIPCNIAPLNFNILNDSDACVVEISSGESSYVFKGPEIRIPEKKWQQLLASGPELEYSIFIKREGKWLALKPFTNTVVQDAIDPYITYRLIEPGYSSYGELMLVQRNLSSFKEQDLYNNSLISGRVEQQCINCHSFQNFKAENFQFHARQTSGGTIIVTGDEGKKVAFKTGDLISNAVYPSWHPTEDMIAYSVNLTAQLFFAEDRQKVEVFDNSSDLILYDVKKNEISYIVHDSLSLETFPYWSYDGKRLYYASAYLPSIGADSATEITSITDKVRYNIYSMDFDLQKKSFGEPTLLFDAQADSLSAVTPRPSPDGKYLLCGVGIYGSFHVWHDSGDIYLTDLATGDTRPLDEINSDKAESFKAWSSNSRWIVFTSRRDDGSYTRLYFSYFDQDGKAHKPFILPQKDPKQNLRLFKSYNVPEFTIDKAAWTPKRIESIVLSEPVQATLKD